MSFDAVSIEYAFAQLIGNPVGARGTSHDADVFRGGNPKDLSKALLDAITALENKAKSVTFTSADAANGGAKARLDVAISRLRDYANELSKSKNVEREDYHWEIIGALISVIAALLEKSV